MCLPTYLKIDQQELAGYFSTNREPFRIGRLNQSTKVSRIEGRRKVNLLNFSHEISEVPFHLHPHVASLGYIDSFSSMDLPFSLFLSLSFSLFYRTMILGTS